MKILRYTLLIFALLISIVAQAQYGRNNRNARFTNKKKYYGIQVNAGTVQFMGDIAPKRQIGSTDLSMIRAYTGIVGLYRVSSRITLAAGVNYIGIAGDDNNLTAEKGPDFGRWKRNLHFRNNMIETSSMFYFDFIPNHGTWLTRPPVVPYFIIGFGVLIHNPQALTPNGDWVNLRDLQTEGVSYGSATVTFMQGFGTKFSIPGIPSWEIGTEVTYRTSTTDYLDDISGNFPQVSDPNSLSWQMSSRSLEEKGAWTGKARDVSLVGTKVYKTTNGTDFTAGRGYGPGEWRGGTNVPDGGSNFDGFFVFNVWNRFIIPQGGLTKAKMGGSSGYAKRKRTINSGSSKNKKRSRR